MENISSEKLFISDIFNLHHSEIKSIRYRNNSNNFNEITVTLSQKDSVCPACGFGHPKVKNYIKKNITHSLLADRKCIIIYNARRFICPVCRKTYYEHNPFVFSSMKISTKVVINVLEQLKDFNETFSSVARRNHITPTTVCDIFDKHVQLSRNPLPEIISIDEVYAFHSLHSKYVCVLLDFVTQEPVDILPERTYNYLSGYFGKIPLEERKKVKLVCSDMYDTYRSIARNCFPNSRCAVDVFHVSQEFHRKMNSIRIRIMKGYNKNEEDEKDEYYLLKHFNWLLFKSNDARDEFGELFDPNRERKKNRHFDRYLNYYDIREMLLKIDNELTEVYDLKLDLREFYKENTFETAKENINDLIQKFLTSSIEEMNAFGRTLVKWKEEIINSFIIIKYEYKINRDDGTVAVHNRRINNALIENRNKVIKCIKHNANGYRNWFRFRNRVLYVLRPGATFSLVPLDVPWKKKKQE